MRVFVSKTKTKLKPVRDGGTIHVIWGDWLDVEEEDPPSTRFIVNWKAWDARSRSVKVQKYLIDKSETQTEPLLEMIFLDVGQGDGCIVNVPDGEDQKILIIDAGQFANVHSFLKWRFRYVNQRPHFHAAVITHPDQDHYLGFQSIFNDQRISFDHVYHNGLIERVVTEGEIIGNVEDGRCTEIFATREEAEALLSDPAVRGRKLYPKLLWTALKDPARFPDVRMASTEHGESRSGQTWLPGFAPDGDKASIEIIGPVPERHDGKLTLKAFGKAPNDGGFDLGKTKNGHSVLLRLCYRDFTVIFGGDLNRPAEDYLLRHYGEIGVDRPLGEAVERARRRLGADMLKVCHHGAADVTDEFLRAVNAFGFVLSSGDEESHVHPRPEILGLLGKTGRGARPLVLCTEILRSTPEGKTLTKEENAEHDALVDAVDNAADAAAKKAARIALSDFWNRRFRRLVNVYGAINIRTDGRRLIVAFRKEAVKTGQSPWQLYEYEIKDGDWAGVELKSAHG